MKNRKKYNTAYEALKFYGAMRTKNGKGVTIPSQIRYVNYFEFCLRQNIKANELKNQRLVLRALHLHNPPPKCNPSFKIKTVGDKKLKDFLFESTVTAEQVAFPHFGFEW